MHLLLYLYEEKTNVNIINCRVINTHLHDDLLLINYKSNSEKYKKNALYKGPLMWSFLPVEVRHYQTYDYLKNHLKKENHSCSYCPLIYTCVMFICRLFL